VSGTLARERDGAASARERLWTPAMPTSFFDGFGIGDVAPARVLWAVCSAPPATGWHLGRRAHGSMRLRPVPQGGRMRQVEPLDEPLVPRRPAVRDEATMSFDDEALETARPR